MSRLRHSPYLLAGLLGLFTLSLYLLTGSSDLLHNGDTDLRIQTTQAMVEHHRLWLADPQFKDNRVARGLGGHLYAFYGPGQSVLMIPLYLAGKVIAHHLNLPYETTELYAMRSLDLFLGAALAVVFFLFALAAGFRRRVAAVLTLLLAVASVAWPDAQSALEQTQVDLFLLIGVLGLWQFLRKGNASARWLLLAGCGVGLAIFTRYDAVLYIPVFAAFIVFARSRQAWRRWREWLPDLLDYGAGLAPWVALVALWNAARFGSPFTTGLHEDTLGNPTWLGVLELIVSPGKGLIWYLPLLFLLPWAVRPFWRRAPRLAIVCAAMILLPLLFYASILYWHGDPAWGPRYLYVAVPYLLLPLGEILSRWQGYRLGFRAAFVAVAAISLGVQVIAVSVTEWRFWYRLQVIQQQAANTDLWQGQPFRWGPSHYHYYWKVAESPIYLQADDVYQVLRIMAGSRQYVETGHPDPLISGTTTVNYPVNSLAFWWQDSMHPLLGPHTRDAIAGLLGLSTAASLLVILLILRASASESERAEPMSGAKTGTRARAARPDRLLPANQRAWMTGLSGSAQETPTEAAAPDGQGSGS